MLRCLMRIISTACSPVSIIVCREKLAYVLPNSRGNKAAANLRLNVKIKSSLLSPPRVYIIKQFVLSPLRVRIILFLSGLEKIFWCPVPQLFHQHKRTASRDFARLPGPAASDCPTSSTGRIRPVISGPHARDVESAMIRSPAAIIIHVMDLKLI